MLKDFQNHIDSNFPELKENPFIIAISGGVDSVVLATICHTLNLDFALAHCNFQLRESESTKDEKFVENLAKTFGCPFFLKRFQTEEFANNQKVSIQLAARNLRYNWFENLIEKENYRFILTAHHLDDQLETFIINLSRSTGLKGLSGIPKKNDYIRRPFLIFSKIEILDFASTQNIAWREDQSNASKKYLRNKIRHQVVSELKKLHPQFLKNFEKTQQKLQQSEDLLEDYTEILFKTLVTNENNRYFIDIQKLKSYQNQEAILYQLLNSFGFTAWDDIYNLIEAETSKKVYSKTHILLKDRGYLTLIALETTDKIDFEVNKGQEYLNTSLGEFNFEFTKNISEISKNIAYLDAEKLNFPLRLRQLQNGDSFYPLGMHGRKKLSDFLKDEEVNLMDKQNQLLFCDDKQNIIWVVNHRIDERYKVEPQTKNILKITYKK
ncbi:tRNA lysidine(34) synthetase TilS [Psychroflexus aestuariivivens]|uniref:tRNA lysidine(34) synthetase TilS n=1 Tax=Psychroflexus aestuariivivens TaxID=1795040 RepID=UPI000FD71F11|nr:tRNA lysidine(34) synthetase TilS [Psychroflexus aestuariivivens]